MIESIKWAFKHTERNVAETGLHTLLELLQNVQASQARGRFGEITSGPRAQSHMRLGEISYASRRDIICVSERSHLNLGAISSEPRRDLI